MMTLIVAEPGPLRDSLVLYLQGLPQVHGVQIAEDESSALHALPEYRPGLVLIVESARRPAAGMIRSLKAEDAAIRILVLTESSEEQLLAEMAGADIVLLNGHPAPGLLRHVANLVSEARDTHLSSGVDIV